MTPPFKIVRESNRKSFDTHMRAPKRRRPQKRQIGVPPNADLQSVADRVTYVGSPEHKDFPSFAGMPRPRADASLCPRSITDAAIVTDWLRSAIIRGATSALWEGGHPRYVWHKEGDTLFEARLNNRSNGSYKGYPLAPQEWPKGIENHYA